MKTSLRKKKMRTIFFDRPKFRPVTLEQLLKAADDARVRVSGYTQEKRDQLESQARALIAKAR